MKRFFFLLSCCALFFSACSKKDDSTTPPASAKLIFKFKFDSTQVRLNNFGQPSSIPPGRSGQSPRFNKISAHYIELAQDSLTAIGYGKVLYRAAETIKGGSNAIDFDKSMVVGEGEVFFSVPFSQLTSGTYRWLRVSLAYQNYDIKFQVNSIDLTGTVASFIGFNTYIGSHKVKDSTDIVNANKLQGYWAFETNGYPVPVSKGQAPPGATTVPNPISSSSPIPPGSCVVTGAFLSPLVIAGNETKDKIITVSLSTNNSFEWIDSNGNGLYEPLNNDTVIDMGIRGLIPILQ